MSCCLLLILTVFLPRVALVGMALFGYAQQAFAGWLWPVLGFLFMPYTTCAYVIAMNEAGGVQGWGLALLIVGVVFDMGGPRGQRLRAQKKGLCHAARRDAMSPPRVVSTPINDRGLRLR